MFTPPWVVFQVRLLRWLPPTQCCYWPCCDTCRKKWLVFKPQNCRSASCSQLFRIRTERFPPPSSHTRVRFVVYRCYYHGCKTSELASWVLLLEFHTHTACCRRESRMGNEKTMKN
jgi:hypothetical protein